MELAGRRLGDFRLLREIGRGGMGIVYEAEQQSLNRRVAVKVLPHSRGLSEAAMARFRREAEAASRLHHPRICSVIATGIDDGVPYIAMQLVAGKPLSLWMRERRGTTAVDDHSGHSFQMDFEESLPDPIREADLDTQPAVPTETGTTSTTRAELLQGVALIAEAARALHAAHQARVIHRDIKPGNIMVTPDMHPVILDFGLARHVEDQAPILTQSGDIMGTPHYMAPELLRGGSIVDARTDVYSLGVTLYELLAGRRPFEAPNRERLYRAILEEEPPPLHSLNPTAPTDLSIVLSTAMERDLNRRYQSAEAFANDLEAILHHEPISARPSSRWLLLKKWARRRPGVATGVVAAFLLLLLALVEAQFFGRQLQEALNQEKEARAMASQSEGRAIKALAEQEALSNQLTEEVRRSRALRLAAEAVSRSEQEPALALHLALRAASELPGPETDRAVRISLSAGPEIQSFLPFRPRLMDDGWNRTTPRGRRAASNRNPERRTGRLRAQVPPGGDVNAAANLIVTLGDTPDSLPVVIDLTSGEVLCVLAGHSGQVRTARFDSRGERVVTAGEDGTVRVYEARTGSQIASLELPRNAFDVGSEMELANFANRDRMIVGVGQDLVALWRYAGAQRGFELRQVQTRYRVVGAPPLAVTPSHLPIVASVATNRVFVMGLGESESLWQILDDPESEESLSALAFLPGSRRLVTGDRAGRLVLWDTSERPARMITSRAGLPGIVRCICPTPDGQILAIGGSNGVVSFLNARDLSQAGQDLTIDGQVTCLEWDERSELLAMGGTDRVARIYSRKLGDVVARFPGHTDAISRLAFTGGQSQLLSFTFEGQVRQFAVLPRADDAVAIEEDLASIEWSKDGTLLGLCTVEGRLLVMDCNRVGRPPILSLVDPELRAFRFGPRDGELLLLRDDPIWLRGISIQGGGTRFELRSALHQRGFAANQGHQLLSVDRDLQQFLCVDPSGQLIFGDLSDPTQDSPRTTEGLVLTRGALVTPRAPNSGWIAASKDGTSYVAVVGPTFDAPIAIRHPLQEIQGLISSPDGRWAVLSGERSSEVLVIPLMEGEAQVINTTRRCAPCFLDDCCLAFVDETFTLQVMNPGSAWTTVRSLPMPATVQRMVPGRSQGTLLVATDSELYELDLASGQRRLTIPLEGSRIADLAYSPDRSQVAVAFTDGTVQFATMDAVERGHSHGPRPLRSEELSRFQLAEEPALIDQQQREQELARRLLKEAIQGTAKATPRPATLVWCVERILSTADPVPELYGDALGYCRIALAQARRPDTELLLLLARAHMALKQWEPAVVALDQARAVTAARDPRLETIQSIREEVGRNLQSTGATPQ